MVWVVEESEEESDPNASGPGGAQPQPPTLENVAIGGGTSSFSSDLALWQQVLQGQ